MKKLTIMFILVFMGHPLFAQQLRYHEHLKTDKALHKFQIENSNKGTYIPGLSTVGIPTKQYKSADSISIIDIGTSANAFSYGFDGGQRSLVCASEELGVVTNFHRMGGTLNPGGYSGDLGFDVSFDSGSSWSVMNECFEAFFGGTWFPMYPARYPQHGIFNPPGNINPSEAYLVFFASTLDGTNSPEGWGGYVFGRSKLNDPTDTTKNFKYTEPGTGIFQYIPEGFTVNSNGDFWAVDYNYDMTFQQYFYDAWLQELIINHGVWNETEEDYELSQFLLPCLTQDTVNLPPCAKVEFSPDGQFGYIVVISDNGTVEISKDHSLYPIIWRTDDFGETWTGPIEVALAGANGIEGVQNFLSDEEIGELFTPPVPGRDEIPFTTAFDFDLSVDGDGNPQIAVVIGVSAEEPYSIITEISENSGSMFTAAFLLSSSDKGNEGSWTGYELGRPVSFRGIFNDITEDNRIQIARSSGGDKMFVAWLDTDTTISDNNNAPDIWTRGIDIVNETLTYNINTLEDTPQNITGGSTASASAWFFAMADEVFYNDELSYPTYTIPIVFEDMDPNNPLEPVQYKYISDFHFYEAQFSAAPPPFGISEYISDIEEVSEVFPNPASTFAFIEITLNSPAFLQVSVSNLLGMIMEDYPGQFYTSGSNSIKIDVSRLLAGIYFITISNGKETITRKLIIE
jgi:hypothetical protein